MALPFICPAITFPGPKETENRHFPGPEETENRHFPDPAITFPGPEETENRHFPDPAITFPGPEETENRHFPAPEGRPIFSFILAEIQVRTLPFFLRRFLPFRVGEKNRRRKRDSCSFINISIYE